MDYLSVIIVAGGFGKRMAKSIPKQFLLLQDRPILMHTLSRFYKAFNNVHLRIIVVINKEYEDYWFDLVKEYKFNVPHLIAYGGKERFYSVKNGLEKCFDKGLVAVHDSVRPFVNKTFLLKLYKEAKLKGNAVPYILPYSSVRLESEGKNWAIERNKVRMIQTPQFFQVLLLKLAYNQEYKILFTDDASVYESIGQRINLVLGLEKNIKITTPLDMLIAQELVRREEDIN